MFTPGKILTLFAITGACCFGALWAKQDSARPARGSVKRTVAPVETTVIVPAEASEEDAIAVVDLPDFPQTFRARSIASSAPNSAANQAVRKAVKQYRDSTTGTVERDNARKLVSDGLGKLYDEHLENQEKQIADLENRLAKLREQVKKRRDAKDKMVELKLELVLSQADGLGWPDSSEGDWLSRTNIGTTLPSGFGFEPAFLPPATPEAPAAPVAPVAPTGAAARN